MKLPIAWLRDYLDVALEEPEIAERFAALGFPVEGIERRPKLAGVVIGRLARVAKHPNADQLSLCTIDIGATQTLTIATAATNVAEGDVVPVATVGAEVVGLSIGRRKMRGIDSEGMLCSASELGLPAEWFEDGILQLEHDLPLGANFVERYRLSDAVFDIEVTANRPDCLAIVGLARELAASLGRPIVEPQTHVVSGSPPFTEVALESVDCTRFVAQRFSGLAVGTSPFWMRARLALAGQRPIDNLVDISNFVMLETGQPLHFYDFAQLAERRVVVRDARADESVRTLDDTERRLDPRYLVIADAREPQCVAGLMGAAASEVSARTSELLLEAATFSGPRIRRMSVALGLRTEASTRHEKGLPLGLSTWGAARAAHLLALAGATAHAPFAAGADDVPAKPIELALARVAALLGVPVTAAEAQAALLALGFAVTLEGASLRVVPPFWRGDVRIAEDVVEEIARIVGYDRVTAEMPPVLPQTVTSDEYRTERRVARALAATGYREAVTLALQPSSHARAYERAGVPTGGIAEVVNPLSEDQRYLRFSLVPALLDLAARYASDEPYRIFELGRVFGEATAGGDALAPDELAGETSGAVWLCALPPREEPTWQDTGFLTFKSESLAFVRALIGREATVRRATRDGWHPGKSADLCIDERTIATIGAVDPRLAHAYDIDGRVYVGRLELDALTPASVARYAAPSRYPAIVRDLALIVASERPAADLDDAIRRASDAVRDVRVFDEYRGPQIASGKKSLAVRFVLQSATATLTDAEAEAHVRAIVASLRERCDAHVRA